GLVLAPFRGVRYAEDRVSGLAEVTSPPYDVIAADIENQLIASDPHNIVRLILPRHPVGQPGSPYDDAAAELSGWLGEGILVPDPGPALYVYEQAAASAGAGGPAVLQRGLIGAIGLVPLSAGIIQPHENVAPPVVAGRRQLMEATQANLEPVFLLYEGDGGAATRLVDEVASTRAPEMEASTSDGLRHRLWAITDPADLAAIEADLAPRTALIADGHHRYAAYLQLRDRERESGAGPGPWDCGLALLVDSTAYPPQLGAIHRVITGLVPHAAARLAAAAFGVRELQGGSADVTAALAALTDAAQDGVSFLLAGAGRAFLLSKPDPALVSAAVIDQPAELWQQLPAAVLQDLLFARLWGIEDDDRSVRAIHDARTAIALAEQEPRGTAVICSPMSASQVYQVAALGRRVPRKSTSFGPKPRTGLVMRLFRAG
ncbi:MAG TPA: DUF1015 domain-containing protein, partial [Streptosporangiaceae bacterium]|nr:DUF1015 domain-containing protein [Streptosporangiaceae bacterium]